MSRYFKVTLEAMESLYPAVKSALELPSPRAEEPFRVTGDFHDATHAYVALSEYHCSVYATLIDGDEETPGFSSMPGVEEITREQYLAAMPPTEPL